MFIYLFIYLFICLYIYYLFIEGGGGRGERYDKYYFFSVNQNVKYIFIDGDRRREKSNKNKLIYRNQLKKLNFDKIFVDIIETELDLTFMAMALRKLRSNNIQML